MKRVYFTLALMSLFGGLNAFADVKQDGVVYEKCLMVSVLLLITMKPQCQKME